MSDFDPARAKALLDLYGYIDRNGEGWREQPDGPEREAVMRQAKDTLVAQMPFKVHAHRIALDLVQPWTRHYWRHPFMRDIWRFVDIAAH